MKKATSKNVSNRKLCKQDKKNIRKNVIGLQEGEIKIRWL